MSKRPGWSLGTRLFLITALLLLFAVGAAVVATWLLGQRIAFAAARERIVATGSVHAAFQEQRYRILEGPVRAMADNPNFRAYMLDALDRRDTASAYDQLGERRRDLGYDLALMLDERGQLFARSDDPEAAATSFADRPFVAQARKGLVSGVFAEGERLYSAVAAPLTYEQDLSPIQYGTLIVGFAIDDRLPTELKRLTGSEVVFLSTGRGGAQPVATTLDATLQNRLLDALRLRGDLLARAAQRGEAIDDVDLELAGRRWMARLTPLLDPAGGAVGAVVALASLDRELASYRQIMGLLGGVGLVALLLALGLSYALSRQSLAPLRRLAAAAEGARRGDFSVRAPEGGPAEVDQLGRAFNELLGDLRERRDMQSFVVELSRTLPESAHAPAPGEPAEVRRLALLAVELRQHARLRAAGSPTQLLEGLGRDLRGAVAAISARAGKVEQVSGHRLLASFDGDGRAHRALAAATEILARGASDADPPLAAVAAGEAVAGAVIWGEAPQRTLLGSPVQQLEGLLREASPGDLLLAQSAHQELVRALAEAGLALSPQRSLLSTQPIYALSIDAAQRAVGLATGPTVATRVPAARGLETPTEIAPGALLGQRFEILSVLGAGGMGVVFKARDRELDDLVALKVLKREAAGDAKLLERLKSEIRLARKITHPNVLRTFDFGELDGVPFISMEYVRGATLRTLLEHSGRLPYSAGLHLAKQLCSGLAAAHALAILHRDIKPENLILNQAGDVKLMDFGLARSAAPLGDGRQTEAGFVVGTPHYLAPEQVEGKEPDFRTDLYAVGVVLYEVFAGLLPFSGANPMEILLKHLNEAPRPPRQHWPEMPEALEAVILRCLEKSPERRFARVEELAAALDALST